MTPVRHAPDAGGITRMHAVLIQLVSIIASVGVGHLVAGLFSPASSPFQAVADAVVRLSPEGLTEFGKSLDFPAIGLPRGVADKVGLLVGIAVVLLVVAALAGIAAYHRRSVGRAVIIVLGVVGFAAVCFSPVFAPVDLLAPLSSMMVGLSAYARLYHLVDSITEPSVRFSVPKVTEGHPEGTSEVPPTAPQLVTPLVTSPVTRRTVLATSAAVGVGAVGAGAVGQLLGAGARIDTSARTALKPRLQPQVAAPPLPAGADFAAQGSPPFLTPNKDFYRIDTALRVPTISAADYQLKVHGMVARELLLSYDDLLRRPLVEQRVTLTCVSNPVNGDLISNASFVGVSLRELLLEAGVRPGAEQIFSTSYDGWTCGTPTSVVLEPDRGAMLALAMNGEPLPLEHGYPVRMVVPGLYGYVSATKWLADIELTTFDRHAYWIDRGWAQLGPIKTQSRIDRPRGLEVVPAGRFTAAGIAWAQHRGISRVEVRLDGGPWQEAQLSTEVSRDTWRMWRADLTLAEGNHAIESRATDGNGKVQPQQRADPIPDGATGWPQINFWAA